MSTRRLMDELRQRIGAGALPPVARPPAHVPVVRHPPPAPLRDRSGGPSLEAASSAVAAARRRPAPVEKPQLLEELKAATPAKVGIGRAGLRYRTETLLQFMADFSVAKAAVNSQVPEGWAAQQGWTALSTRAADPDTFLARPDLGRCLDEESMALIESRFARDPDVQIVVGDGLSATAVMQNAPPMVQALVEELERQGKRSGTIAFVRHCRAKLVDVIGERVGARVGIILIGERPGLGTGDGMSAYLVWGPQAARTDAEKQAISNIHRRGMAPEDAGRHAARLIEAIVAQQTSGVGLDVSGIKLPRAERERINQAHPEPLAGCGQSHGQQCSAARDGRPGQTCSRSADRPCEINTH